MKQVNIIGLDMPLTEGLRQHVLRRMAAAFDRIELRVASATVRVGDINGPRGGRDKVCRVLVRMAGMEDVYVEARDADLYQAATRAIDRAAWTCVRRLRQAKRRLTGWHARPWQFEPA